MSLPALFFPSPSFQPSLALFSFSLTSWTYLDLVLWSWTQQFSFVFFSSRIQYATLLFVGILTFELLQLKRKTTSFRSVILKILCIAIGSIASFFIFYQRGIANTEDIGVRNLNESISSLANSLSFRVFFLLTIFALLVKVKPQHHLLVIIVCASCS